MIASEADEVGDPPGSADPVWILGGSRPGELEQQRAVAKAIGLPFREVRVATQDLAGPGARFDLDALIAPWPAVAISFGRTLPAAVELRRRSGARTRIVQIGRPRGVDWLDLDLIVPLPHDVVPDTSNMVRIRMPLNPSRHRASRGTLDPASRRFRLCVIGGATRQHRFDAEGVAQWLRDLAQRSRAEGRTLLISTSPRTPTQVIDALPRNLDGVGDIYVFDPRDRFNPLARWIEQVDDVFVTGDSPSMIAEFWRSGKPVCVYPVPDDTAYAISRRVRRWLPQRAFTSGRVAAPIDVNAWLRSIADCGIVTIWGAPPAAPMERPPDDDLERVAARVRSLMTAG